MGRPTSTRGYCIQHSDHWHLASGSPWLTRMPDAMQAVRGDTQGQRWLVIDTSSELLLGVVRGV